MNKTLKISFSLKNTYRVNGVLFSLKQPQMWQKRPLAFYVKRVIGQRVCRLQRKKNYALVRKWTVIQ